MVTQTWAFGWRFGKLTVGILVVLVLAIVCEGFVLSLAGQRYVPKSTMRNAIIGSLGVSADGSWAVSRVGIARQGFDHRLELDLVLHDLRNSQAARLNVGELKPEIVSVASDGAIYFGSLDGTIYEWQPDSTSDQVADFQPTQRRIIARVQVGPVRELQVSPNGEFLGAADSKHVYVWRCRSGELVRQLPHGSEQYPVLAFANDSQRALSSNEGGNLQLWDLESGDTVTTLSADTLMYGAAFSPAGDRAAVLVAGTVRVYALPSGIEQWRQCWTRGVGYSLAFSQDGSEVCIGNIPGVRIYDAASGHLRAPLAEKTSVKGHTIAPNGALYTWDNKGDIRAWNIERRQAFWQFSLLAWGRGEQQAELPDRTSRHGVVARGKSGGTFALARTK